MSDLHEPGAPMPCEMAWLLGGRIVGEVTAPESEDRNHSEVGQFQLEKYIRIYTQQFLGSNCSPN